MSFIVKYILFKHLAKNVNNDISIEIDDSSYPETISLTSKTNKESYYLNIHTFLNVNNVELIYFLPDFN